VYGGYFLQANFAGLQSLGMEPHGLLANPGIFANGLTGPVSYTTFMSPTDVTLAANGNVVDKGRVLPNISDNYVGAGPDIGALELGCPEPTYGPRPAGVDETSEIHGCTSVPAVESIAVTPASVTLSATQTQQFSATTVPAKSAVVWSVSPPRGTITADGSYTAPADARQGELITVTAASATSPAILASASVSISLPAIPHTVRTFIDIPAPSAVMSGTSTIAGWAVASTNALAPDTISSIRVFMDGTQVGTADYGVSRPDVCAAFPDSASCPNVGWSYSLNVSSLVAGYHVLEIIATDAMNNNSSTLESILVSPPLPSIYIDLPAQNAVLNGTVAINGWAIDNIYGVGDAAISSVKVLVDGVEVGAAIYGLSRPDVCVALPGRMGCPNVGWNYSLNTAKLDSGSHILQMEATDAAGNSSSQTTTFFK
jgi:hypothetical protein